MDLIAILRSRINALPEGNYTPGLKAVFQHVEVAARHLARGQSTADDTAFTDAIYRTNQAFEGSLKEAFRVLAGKDPGKERPFDIENYLQQQSVLRPRVLSQLTNYRKEWRNPSAHDYSLDFDEDEALLAIVTVSAFAIVLIDQITERIAFEQARETATAQATPVENFHSLTERVVNLLEQFTAQFNQTYVDRSEIREVSVVGALSGFLSSTAPDLDSYIEAKLSPEQSGRADLLLVSGTEKLILEVKLFRASRSLGFNSRLIQNSIQQVSNYIAISNIQKAIVYVYGVPNTGKLVRSEHSPPGVNGQITIVSTEPNVA